MAEFYKTFDISQFKVFNAAYKEVLSGSERAILDYMLYKRLTYVRKDKKYYYGNTINISQSFKNEILNKFEISISTYQRLITKLVKSGVFFRIKKDFYSVNPYCFARGEDLKYIKENGPFKEKFLGNSDKPFKREKFFESEEEKQKRLEAEAKKKSKSKIKMPD